MKKKRLILFATLCAVAFSGCGKTVSDYVKEEPVKQEIKTTEQASEIVEEETETEVLPEGMTEVESGFSFAEVVDWEFCFASGAGAWSTLLYINEDGSFEGNYHDTDMGDDGEGYPAGVVYYCDFKGKFTKPEKIDEYTYKFQIEEITFANEVGTEEIIEEQKYIYSDAYGLENAKDFYMYLPGAPTEGLSEEFLSWIHMYDYEGQKAEEEKLSFYVLYNVEQEEAFSSYDYSGEQNLVTDGADSEGTTADSAGLSLQQQAMNIAEATKKEVEPLEDKLANESLSQLDMNMTEGEIYEKWDKALNDVWKLMKENLPEEQMDKLLKEQRTWIKDKEKQMQAVYAEYEGGSMQGLVYNAKGAELTEKRVYELVGYLQ